MATAVSGTTTTMGAADGAFSTGAMGNKNGVYKATASQVAASGDGISFKASSDNAIYGGSTFQNSALRLIAIIKI